MAHQVLIVDLFGLTFIPISSKFIPSSLNVVLLLDYPVILFVVPVIFKEVEYFSFDLDLLHFMEFVSIHGIVESSEPFPHVVDFHQMEMSLLHFLAKIPYHHRSLDNSQNLFVQFSLIYTICDKVPILVNFILMPHFFETLFEGLAHQVLGSEL